MNKSGSQHKPVAGAKRRLELLAPAGEEDAAYAAFDYGADAIYLGLPRFSARADAVNFTPDALERVTTHAHRLGRRVYAALNTLVLERELEEVVEALAQVAEIGVDALIIQDAGMLRLAKAICPQIERHASTQMAIHNLPGAQMTKALGFEQVTLARELTLEEIRSISRSSGVKTEVFVHGALCYSYSGLCLFSSLLRGRSGNRGRCAYPCRDRYGAGKKQSGFVFSMKDLALPEAIDSLRSAGVSCLKVEGRKKSPLYVATVTDYYRKLIDGELKDSQRQKMEEDIRTVFSRPWTPLYLNRRREPETVDATWVGHRGAPIGKVERIVHEGRQTWLQFRTSRTLERHDGLQIDAPGLDKPFGFAIGEMRLATAASRASHPARRPPPGLRPAMAPPAQGLISVPAGRVVDVLLPYDHAILPDGAPVYCASSQAVKRSFPFQRPRPDDCRRHWPLDLELTIQPQALAVTARCETSSVGALATTFQLDFETPFAPARQKDGTDQAIRNAFGKLGDTRYAVRRMTIQNPDGLFVPVSILNDFRRQFAARMDAVYTQARQEWLTRLRTENIPAAGEIRAAPEEFWSIKTDRPDALSALPAEELAKLDELILEIGPDALPDTLPLPQEKIRLALPAICRAWELPAIQARVTTAIQAGYVRWQATGWYALKLLQEAGQTAGIPLNVTADWPLYTVNSPAAREIEGTGVCGVTASPEDGLENIGQWLRAAPVPVQVIVYQDTPLFISETCARRTLAGSCPPAGCDKPQSLENPAREVAQVIQRDCRCYTISRQPLCWSGQLAELRAAGARHFRADFSLREYAPEDVLRIWRLVRSGQPVPQTMTGNFVRGMA